MQEKMQNYTAILVDWIPTELLDVSLWHPSVIWALVAVSAYSLYRMIFAPVTMKSMPTYDGTNPRTLRRKQAHTPPTFPNGWFAVCGAADIDGGQVHSISALGLELVAFRGKGGKASVLEAFCPHLGAHLGQGGTVDAKGRLVCPFHKWKFETDGTVSDIPYCKGGGVPERAKTTSYELREIAGVIFLWFHADGKPPAYELSLTQQLADQSNFSFGGMCNSQWSQHIAEIPMNGADTNHFNELHADIPVPFLGKVLRLTHEVTGHFMEDAESYNLPGTQCAVTEERVIHMDLFGKIRIPLEWLLIRRFRTRITFEGPGIMHFTVFTPMGNYRQLTTMLPVGPLNTYTQHRWFIPRGSPRIVCRILAKIGMHALNQDRQCWENKLWKDKVMWVKGDGPFPAFKRWYDQFYSEGSREHGKKYDW